MNSIKVLVLYGGSSAEREVSLRSGQAVADALTAAGYDTRLYDTCAGIENDSFAAVVAAHDVVFPVLHGRGGEDGIVQQILEQLGAVYVGSDAPVSAHCFDKLRTLQTLQAAGILVPQTIEVTKGAFHVSDQSSRPFVLKPNDEGSSIDTWIVTDPTKADMAAIDESFTRHPTMLLEPYIFGIELTVPIFGDHALPVIEIIPPTEATFDYENKYNGRTQELCPPEHLDQQVQAQARAIAERVHSSMGCRDLSRVDFIYGVDGNLYCLEINTLPGMTATSLYPKSALVAGSTMSQLADALVRRAIDR